MLNSSSTCFENLSATKRATSESRRALLISDEKSTNCDCETLPRRPENNDVNLWPREWFGSQNTNVLSSNVVLLDPALGYVTRPVNQYTYGLADKDELIINLSSSDIEKYRVG